MPEQVLTILEAHTGDAQAMPECVLEVMHANVVQSEPPPCGYPCTSVHSVIRLARSSIDENPVPMLTSTRRNDRRGAPVENNQTVAPILVLLGGDNEHARCKLREFYFPLPSKSAYFLLPKT